MKTRHPFMSPTRMFYTPLYLKNREKKGSNWMLCENMNKKSEISLVITEIRTVQNITMGCVLAGHQKSKNVPKRPRIRKNLRRLFFLPVVCVDVYCVRRRRLQWGSLCERRHMLCVSSVCGRHWMRGKRKKRVWFWCWGG